MRRTYTVMMSVSQTKLFPVTTETVCNSFAKCVTVPDQMTGSLRCTTTMHATLYCTEVDNSGLQGAEWPVYTLPGR